ncbi:MAG TPA: hypothetical protein VK435_08415, partial [Thermodesulfovibrionales bacterium]|nr:hypothetical protein [Thermodesulfovibrionales bacterium]
MKLSEVSFLIWLSLILCLLSPSCAYADETSIYPVEDHITVIVPYGSDEGNAFLKIRNKSGKDIPLEITASALTQEKTGKKAVMEVLCGHKEARECSVKASSVSDLRVHASGISGNYQFTGLVVIGSQNKKYIVRVSVQKQSPPPAIELVGSEKGRLEITKDSQGKDNFTLTFKNPDGGVFRALTIGDFRLEDDSRVLESDIKEKSFSLEPGAEKLIRVSFSDIPKGSYQGILSLEDSRNRYLTQQFTIHLNSQYLTLGNFYNLRMFVVLILVLSGGIVSVVLTKCLPISSARRKNRQDIEDCRERIQSLVVFETELRIKLIVELIKARTLNDNTKVYTPSANDRLKTIETTLAGIHKQLDVRAKVRDIYISIDSSDTLPFSKEQEVRRVLRDADASIYAGNLDFAEGRIAEATALQKFDLTREADLKQHFEWLCGKIEELQTRIDEDAELGHASPDVFMKQLRDD